MRGLVQVRVKRHRYSRLSGAGLYLMMLRRSVQVFYMRKVALRGMVSKTNPLAFPLHGFFAVRMVETDLSCKRREAIPSYFKSTWKRRNKC